MRYCSRNVKLLRHGASQEAKIKVARVRSSPLNETLGAAESLEHLGGLLLGKSSKLVSYSRPPTTNFVHTFLEHHSILFYLWARFVETHACGCSPRQANRVETSCDFPVDQAARKAAKSFTTV